MSSVDRFQPWYSGIDVNVPSEEDVKLTGVLKKYIDEVSPLTTKEEKLVRIQLLEELRDMLNSWVLRKLEERHVIFEGDENELAGRVFVSGSYRLGVDTQGSDIDTICTIPIPLTRDDFFSEEDGMVSLLRKHKDVSYVNPVTGARVPIIEVVWNGIDLDVLCAIIQKPIVPQKPDELLDDKVLIGMDEASRMTLNGPRVTELMIVLIPNRETFSLILRCVRFWAKRRGIYANKIGFLGGVNWAILVAFTCQLFPTATPSRLLFQFFQLYRTWKWPTEIRLCHPYEVDGMNEEQWEVSRAGGELMPIITPAYPTMNSSYTVTKYTLRIMSDEFARGERCIGRVRARNNENLITDPKEFSSLFEPTEFFVRFSTYVVVKATSPDDDTLNRWSGWVEARLRRISVEFERFCFEYIYTFPKKFTHDGIYIPHQPKDFQPQLKAKDDKKDEEEKKNEEEKKDEETDELEEKKPSDDEEKESSESKEKSLPVACYWYIGIKPHPINSLRSGSTIDMSAVSAQWALNIKRWPERAEHMDVDVSCINWKGLPDDPAMFPEGKAAAKKTHKEWVRSIREENARIKREYAGTTAEEEEEKTNVKTETTEASAPVAEEAPTDSSAMESNGVKKEEKEDENGDKALDNLEKMQNVLAKRMRDEMIANESLKKSKVDNVDFYALPAVPGIDTTEPVKIIY